MFGAFAVLIPRVHAHQFDAASSLDEPEATNGSDILRAQHQEVRCMVESSRVLPAGLQARTWPGDRSPQRCRALARNPAPN